ncbi:DNA polymerase [Vibrio parahaemolyticus]|nr:DNA polymerase [Vibrio parahaemolyticus]
MSIKNTAIIDGNSLFVGEKLDIPVLTMTARTLLKDYLPDFTSCFFDKSKENRPDVQQAKSILSALGYNVTFTDKPIDLAANLTKDKSFIFATNNRSFCQFLGEGSLVFSLNSNQIIDEQIIRNVLGITPALIPEFLAVCGDMDQGFEPVCMSDPSLIAKFINENSKSESFYDLLYSNFSISVSKDELKNRVGLLTGNLSQSFMLSSISRKAIDPERLYDSYKNNKMYYWLPDADRLQSGFTIDGSLYSRAIVGEENLEAALHHIGKKKSCYIYTDNLCANNEVISISPDQSETYIFRLNSPELKELLNFISRNEDVVVATNNTKEIIKALNLDYGFKNRIISDFDLGYYVLDSRQSKTSFGQRISDLVKINLKPDRLINKSENIHEVYAAIADKTDASLRACRQVHRLLRRENNDGYLRNIEIPSAFSLASMEDTGVVVNYVLLQSMLNNLAKKVAVLESEIKSITNTEFDVNSPAKLAEVLYDKLKLPAPKNRSTNEEALRQLQNKHTVIGKILDFRKYSYIKNNVVSPIITRVSKDEPLIKCTFTQDVTATGRLSTIDPNLQGLPSKDVIAKHVKTAFVSRFFDGRILSLDYSQIELRILAHLSQDPKLLQAFKDGKDIHRATAAEVFSVPESQVTDDQRRAAKSINFGLIYGMTKYGLAKDLNSTVQEAQRYMELYFSRYPQVEKYLNGVREFAIKNGYVNTIGGRRILIENADSNDERLRDKALRQAVNAPMQGSAAELIKMAMCSVSDLIDTQQMKSKLVLQVHDELVFDVHPDEAESFYLLIKNKMEKIVNLSVPLVVDAEQGLNWGSVKEISPETSKKQRKTNELTV